MVLFPDAKSDIESRLNTINELLTYSDEKHIIYQVEAWKEIVSLLKYYVVYMIQDVYIKHLIKLTVKLAGTYYKQVDMRDRYITRKNKIRKSRKTLSLLEDIIRKMFSHGRYLDFKILIDAFNNDYYWLYEGFCTMVIASYINSSKHNSSVFRQLLDSIEMNTIETGNVPKAKSILKIIADLCKDNRYWPPHDQFLIIKLLDMHIQSIGDTTEVRHSLEYCLNCILHILSNANILYVIEYVLEYINARELSPNNLRHVAFSIQLAASIYRTEYSLWTCFKYDTFKNIVKLMSSKNPMKCIFGNQTFQSIISSTVNMEQLQIPKIWFFQINYSIKIRKLLYEDKEFIKRYRKEIHLCFLSAVKYHYKDIKILMNIYTSLSLLIIEVPCEFTAALIVCLLMNIQKNVLADKNIKCPDSNRVHAVIISIMSLVCWVTNANALYTYLDKILKLRAYNAPFLNPPLKTKYTYAAHYVLWNKIDFFFDNFEVRYALWKRFRLNDKYSDQETEKVKKKMSKVFS